MAVFKVDYALSEPIPWKAQDCLRAATVHLGGTAEEITASESADAAASTPNVLSFLLAQPSLFDPSRAPAGEAHRLGVLPCPEWIDRRYAGKNRESDRTLRAGISRLRSRATHSFPVALEAMDANLIGGDINGGAMDIRPILFTRRRRVLRDSSPKVISVLVVYAAGRRRARNVRVSRGEAGAVTSALNRNSKLSTNTNEVPI